MWALLWIAVVGFFAQLVDGAVGMGFGITATTFLIAVGYGPAMASAIVHLTEIPTSLASGAFHIRFGNVDWRALLLVGIPGAVGAFTGAVLLTSVDLSVARPASSAILLLLGLLILFKFSRPKVLAPTRHPHAGWLVPLGLFGGFVDSSGGGGWGPIVTTSLTASSALVPRRAIGTANTAEFLVALAASAGFITGIGVSSIEWPSVLALIVGGVIAAPIAARLVSVAPQRFLGILTGGAILILNTYILSSSLGATWLVVISLLLVATGLFVWALIVGSRQHASGSARLSAQDDIEEGVH